MKTKHFVSASVAIALAPSLAAAQTFGDTLSRVSDFLNQIIPFIFLVATIVFLWGVLKYVTAGGDEEKAKEGRAMMLNGIIFLAVMIAVWAFVNVAIDFVFGEGTDFSIPGTDRVPRQ
ncbi:MAG: hypothetical protein A2756_04805 [Candidatus Ryanbacteria bacterium RIFCSPHIGHO2_01_FULL_48_27]|uniref:TrbC/VirB2 family protein n=1 Tax=Candidatus Ryanbacteria bacterium RIFCSPHIGHO2_01_FULL_48_27 TaxID=1802115 RepID=A0A1G2G0T3_9BACT|nr:MAG: hypothetical protein A2756_04805 [Candidatus Ryanbacteria bacterium RIFCSPHIGHO2_01_FULL_48_27]